MSEIVETTKEITVYTVGGVEFTTREAAEARLEQLKSVLGFRYYPVLFGLDYNTGKYGSMQIVGVQDEPYGSAPVNAIYEFCTHLFGKPIVEFYDHPRDNWQVLESEEFDSADALAAWLQMQATKWAVDGLRVLSTVFCDRWGASTIDNAL